MSSTGIDSEAKLHARTVIENDGTVHNDDAASDDRVLGALGYKQEFKRDMTIFGSLGVSVSALALLPSIASTLAYGLGYAGTAGLVWGWIIAALMIQTVALSMAEICSSLPTAGGLYYAAAVLAPEGWGPMASWFVGWSNMCAYVVGPCSCGYALAAMIITAAEIGNPDYVGEVWHIYLVLLLILVIQAVASMQSTRVVGMIMIVGAVVNTIVVFIFIIWMPVGSINSPKTNDSHTVWTSFTNGTPWPVGWAVIMSFITTMYTICGYDAPFHLSEECSNANIASPRAIVMTAQAGLYMGLGVILVIAYTVTDIGSVLNNTYGQPFAVLCVSVLGTRAGLAMFSLNAIAQIFGGIGVTVTATRVVFAYSRDGAIVGSRWWARISPLTRTPVIATWGITFIAALLGLLSFAGPYAIGAVFSIAAIGQYTAFTTPIALKLFFDNGKFRRGPWHLGRWSNPINACAVAWWMVITPALCFPAYKGMDLTAQSMNWTCLIFGGVMALAMAHYALSGRKWFTGPRVNFDHIDAVVPAATVDSSTSTSEKERYTY